MSVSVAFFSSCTLEKYRSLKWKICRNPENKMGTRRKLIHFNENNDYFLKTLFAMRM